MKYLFLGLALTIGITSATSPVPIKFPQKGIPQTYTNPATDTSTDHKLRLAIEKHNVLVAEDDAIKERTRQRNILLQRKVDSLTELCEVKKLDPNNIILITNK